METESADIDPQQHLRQLDDAATAARRDAPTQAARTNRGGRPS